MLGWAEGPSRMHKKNESLWPAHIVSAGRGEPGCDSVPRGHTLQLWPSPGHWHQMVVPVRGRKEEEEEEKKERQRKKEKESWGERDGDWGVGELEGRREEERERE